MVRGLVESVMGGVLAPNPNPNPPPLPPHTHTHNTGAWALLGVAAVLVGVLVVSMTHPFGRSRWSALGVWLHVNEDALLAFYSKAGVFVQTCQTIFLVAANRECGRRLNALPTHGSNARHQWEVHG